MHRVLLVDDDEGVLHALRRELRLDAGDGEVFEPECFASPQQALARAAEQPFDVVVADFQMPKMDGAELIAEVKKLRPYVASIVLSGQVDRAGLVRAINNAHIDFFLTKPWEPYELRCMIRQATRQAALRIDNDRIAQALKKHVDVSRLLKTSDRRRILVVDDEVAVVRAIERELRDHSDDFEEIYISLCLKTRLGPEGDAGGLNYEIVTATSPSEALRLAAAESFDLLVTDFAMPELNGLELGLRLRKTHPDLAMILISGQADLNAVRDSLNLGHVAFFLAKPWAREQLKLFVAHALRYRDLQRESRKLAQWLRQRKPELRKLS